MGIVGVKSNQNWVGKIITYLLVSCASLASILGCKRMQQYVTSWVLKVTYLFLIIMKKKNEKAFF